VIIGAGAVVSGTVEPYHIVAGNPARVIRPRCLPETVAELLRLCWWDWPVQRIEAAVPALLSGDLKALRGLALTAEAQAKTEALDPARRLP
jgi:virginiamycin A acetyltransferase